MSWKEEVKEKCGTKIGFSKQVKSKGQVVKSRADDNITKLSTALNDKRSADYYSNM